MEELALGYFLEWLKEQSMGRIIVILFGIRYVVIELTIRSVHVSIQKQLEAYFTPLPSNPDEKPKDTSPTLPRD